jgi:hypothetical protein
MERLLRGTHIATSPTMSLAIFISLSARGFSLSPPPPLPVFFRPSIWLSNNSLN